MRFALAAALTLAAAGCFSPNLGEGKVLCGANNLCPTGYVCLGDGRCYTAGTTIDSGGDGGAVPFDLSGVDLANCVHTTCDVDECGVIPDVCGGTVDCGDPCTTGTSCGGGGTPHVCGCPSQVACGARNCGKIPDGCGGVESCGGACPFGETCGGGGGGMKMPNVCAAGPLCMPKACQNDKDCGLISDGCSAVLDCGACGNGKSCGADHMCH